MALCKYIQRHGFRQFSVGCQLLSNELDFHKSYKSVERRKKDPKTISKWDDQLIVRPWIENWEIMKYAKASKKKEKKQEYSHHRDELLMTFQKIRPLLLYKGEIKKYFQKKILEAKLRRQSFFQHRVDVLGPDLGAAHFMLNRGGRIKFWGQKDWITRQNVGSRLPTRYVPGLYIIAIDATGTDLYYEGIDCLRYLNKLKWLRLKGLTNLNDFSLDIISGRYGPQLEYLDLTGCTGITHFGLSGFYRFKCLKGLNVTGLNHTPEFHLSCLMIQDLLPDLDIIGIDFSQYLKDKEKERPLMENVEQVDNKTIV